MKHKKRNSWAIAGKVVLTILLLMAGFFCMIIASLSRTEPGVNFNAIAVIVTSLMLLILVWAGRKNRKVFVICLALIAMSWGIVGIKYAVKQHEKSLVVKTDVNIPLEYYMPFEDGSKIVELSEEPTLKLETNLPKLDGAAAVFPVYSAFVNAVYPYRNETRLVTEYYSEKNDGPSAFNYFNTRTGYVALAERKTDIFFGAYPSKSQIAYATEQGTEFEFTPIGREAFVFFVNVKSDVDNLSSEDIKKIYSGQITDWSQLGFKAGKITAFQRGDGSGSQSMFLRFMGNVTPTEPPTEERIDTMMGAYQVVSDYKNSKGAIGFSFRYYLESIVARDDVKMISVDGVAPTIENIKSGKYPITGDLYAVTWKGNPNENVQRLLDWILGPQGQYIIEKTGYAPLS